MLEDACVEIEQLTKRDRQERRQKYARRNRMRYIDRLLNELEMLNLADQTRTPREIALAVDELVEEENVTGAQKTPGPPTSLPPPVPAPAR